VKNPANPACPALFHIPLGPTEPAPETQREGLCCTWVSEATNFASPLRMRPYPQPSQSVHNCSTNDIFDILTHSLAFPFVHQLQSFCISFAFFLCTIATWKEAPADKL